MNRKILITPSVMCFHAWELPEYIKAFEEVGVDTIHFDVMDGHFVDNIMLGSSMYRDIIHLTKLPVDIHLMCHEPQRFLNYFKPRENDWVSFHPITCNHPYGLLQAIRDRGARSGIALDPGTPIDCLEEVKSVLDFVLVMGVNPGFAGQTLVPDHFDKLKRISLMLERLELELNLIVDGNTSVGNARKMHLAGANGFVVGTASLIKGADYFRNNYLNYIESIKEEL